MRRRDFIGLLGAAAVIPAPAIGAEPQAGTPRLGVLVYSNLEADPQMGVFDGALRDEGYTFGQNLAVEYRYAEGKPERLPDLAADLVRLKPDVLFAIGGDVAPFLTNVTQTIPLVFAMSADPVKLGLAASLARPGRNATGVTFLQDELASKRLELLKEAVPGISRVAFFWNPDHADNEVIEAQRAAAALGVGLQFVELRGASDLDGAFKSAERNSADALYVVSSRQTVANMAEIIAFASKNKIPLAGGWGAWAQAGGLLSYGPNVSDLVRTAASYVHKILRGAKPSELPIQQPSRFELVVNLKTARALSLPMPASLLSRSDTVIPE